MYRWEEKWIMVAKSIKNESKLNSFEYLLVKEDFIAFNHFSHHMLSWKLHLLLILCFLDWGWHANSSYIFIFTLIYIFSSRLSNTYYPNVKNVLVFEPMVILWNIFTECNCIILLPRLHASFPLCLQNGFKNDEKIREFLNF